MMRDGMIQVRRVPGSRPNSAFSWSSAHKARISLSGGAATPKLRNFRNPLLGRKWQKRLQKKLCLRPILWCNRRAYIYTDSSSKFIKGYASFATF
jgi:hypothetical protein